MKSQAAPCRRVLPAAGPDKDLEEAPPAAPLPVRFDNDQFFGDRMRPQALAVVPEDVFYAGALRPPPEMPLALRTSLTPLRFALVLFLVGWAGILFQAGFFQQVVFGAPVFEEMAKVGLALLPVVLLRIRGLWLRVPFGLASGAGFGVMEHYTTYSDEPAWMFAGRILFHAVTAGLSMAFYDAFDELGDPRARWATTAVPTLFHWANNFGAVVFGFGSLVLPALDPVGTGWATLVTFSVTFLLVVALLAPGRFRARSRETLLRAMPRLRMAESQADGR